MLRLSAGIQIYYMLLILKRDCAHMWQCAAHHTDTLTRVLHKVFPRNAGLSARYRLESISGLAVYNGPDLIFVQSQFE